MLHLQTQQHKLKAKAIVYVISDVSDINLLDFLSLSDAVIQNIQMKLSQNESFCEVYFLEHKIHTHLYVLYSKEKDFKAETIFFGKNFSQLP